MFFLLESDECELIYVCYTKRNSSLSACVEREKLDEVLVTSLVRIAHLKCSCTKCVCIKRVREV